NNFNALVDDETVVNGLEYVVTPLLAEVYKGGDTRGQGIVDTYLQENVGDGELYLVSQGDPEGDLMPAIVDRIIAGPTTTTTSPDDEQRRLTPNPLPADFGIIDDGVALGGDYKTPLSVPYKTQNDNGEHETRWGQEYGKVTTDGRNVAMVIVSDEDNYDEGFIAITERNVNGKNQTVAVDPDDDFKPFIHETDEGDRYVMSLQKTEAFKGVIHYYRMPIKVNQIPLSDSGTTDDIFETSLDIQALFEEQGKTFDSFTALKELDQFPKLKIPPGPSIPLNDGNAVKVVHPNFRKLNRIPKKVKFPSDKIPPDPTKAIREILGDVIKSGGVNNASNVQIQDLYMLVANLDWAYKGAKGEIRPSTQLTTDEKVLALDIITRNDHDMDDINNLDRQVKWNLSVSDKNARVLPSSIEGLVGEKIKNITEYIDQDIYLTGGLKDGATILGSLDNWKNLNLNERAKVVRKLVNHITNGLGMPELGEGILFTELKGRGGVDFLPRSSTRTSPDAIFIDNSFLMSASYPEIIDNLGRELAIYWMVAAKPDNIPWAIRKYNALSFKNRASYNLDFAKNDLFYKWPTNIISIYIGSQLGRHFAEKSEMYHNVNPETRQVLYGAPLLTSEKSKFDLLTAPVSDSNPRSLNPFITMKQQIFSTNGYYTARFFVQDDEIHFGVMTNPLYKDKSRAGEDTSKSGTVVWSKPVWDLQDGPVKDIELKTDPVDGHLIAYIAAKNPTKDKVVDIFNYDPGQIKILEQAKNNSTLNSNRLTLTDNGELEQQVKLTATETPEVAFKTENQNENFPYNLIDIGDTLHMGDSMDADSFLESENGDYILGFDGYPGDDRSNAYKILEVMEYNGNLLYHRADTIAEVNPDDNAGKLGTLVFDKYGLSLYENNTVTHILPIPASKAIQEDETDVQLTLEDNGSLIVYVNKGKDNERSFKLR
ncbi:MAG: hypothetical protein AAF228_03570, partial [Pseudomonadota bacterium]